MSPNATRKMYLLEKFPQLHVDCELMDVKIFCESKFGRFALMQNISRRKNSGYWYRTVASEKVEGEDRGR